MNKWNIIVLVLILGFISNLCVWYFVWLFGTIIWQNARNVRIALLLPFFYELLISYYFFLGVEWAIKTCWFSIASVAILAFVLVWRKEFMRLSRKFNKKCLVKG